MNALPPIFHHLPAVLTISAFAFFGCGSSGSEDSDSDPPSCITIENSTEIEGDTTLDSDCYTIEAILSIDHGTLSVSGGTTLHFSNGSGLSVQGAARLQVIGDTDQPVVLRGTEGERGLWRGIYIDSPGPHQLEGLQLQDAGGDNWAGQPHLTRGGIVVGSDSTELQIMDSHFRNNEYAAITTATPDATIEVSRSRFEDNDFPLRFHANHLSGIDGDNHFVDNRTNAVLVHTDEPVLRQSTWAALDAPYTFDEIVQIKNLVTIEPGTTLSFRRNTGLDIDGGSLRVDASNAQPVRFVGVHDTPGSWRGIRFRNTPPAGNQLTHIEIHHAGSERWVQDWGNSQAAILVDQDGFLDLNDALIADSDYHAISVRDALLVGCEALRFENNHRHSVHSYEDDESCYD